MVTKICFEFIGNLIILLMSNVSLCAFFFLIRRSLFFVLAKGCSSWGGNPQEDIAEVSQTKGHFV